MDAVKIGNTLKNLRESQQLTQAEVAGYLGVSQSAVANYEAGIRVPRDEVKMAYARLFDESIQLIFFS